MNRRMLGILAAVPLLALRASLLAGAKDEAANPLFEQLRSKGVAVTAETTVPLPPPVMADGLDAAEQQKILQKVVGERFPVRDFVGKVGTAPHVYHIHKVPAAGSDALRAFRIDASFVAY